MDTPRALTLDPEDDRPPLARFEEDDIMAVVIHAEDGGVDVCLCVEPSQYLVDILECALLVVKRSLAEHTELLQKRPS